MKTLCVNTNLLILGAGQYGHLVREIAELCKVDHGFNKIAFLDDSSTEAIGGFCDLAKFVGEYRSALVAIGNPEMRRELVNVLKEKGFELPILCHPKAWISSFADIREGCIVEANAVVNTAVKIGVASFVCSGAVVNHNAIVGDFCQIDCNAVVKGGASVPDCTKVDSCMFYT